MREEYSRLQDTAETDSPVMDETTVADLPPAQSNHHNSLNLSKDLDPAELSTILANIESVNLSSITHPNTFNIDTKGSVLLIVGSALNLAGFWSSTEYNESSKDKTPQLQERIILAYDTYMNDYNDASGTANIDKIIKDLYDDFSDKMINHQQVNTEPAILQTLHLLKAKTRTSPIIDDYFTKADRIMRLMILDDMSRE